MRRRSFYFVAAALITAAHLSTLSADTVVSFTETFDAGDANWRGADPAGGDVLDFVVSGGPDGSSYVSFESSFENFPDGSGMGGGQPTPVLFRGQSSFGSSSGAFVGDWIGDRVTTFSFSFRHNLPTPTTVFARFASPFNFPGGLAVEFTPALPNQWTDVEISIDANNPQFISFEGSDFESVFSNVGNIQLGVSVPVGLGGTAESFRFDVDNVSVTTVPEPGAGLIVLTFGLASTCHRRKRRMI